APPQGGWGNLWSAGPIPVWGGGPPQRRGGLPLVPPQRRVFFPVGAAICRPWLLQTERACRDDRPRSSVVIAD
ncbi:MAG: hypothetical protein FWH14_04205, partial [Oscillospiraceae bacterium]|nr:hypothetical protein [Oscillospiraceae bacterium]